MDSAVATLQMAARELQAAKAGDKLAYTQIVAKLRKVADQLSGIDRRADQEKVEPVDYAAILRDAVNKAASVERIGAKLTVDLPEHAMVAGPASDLRNVVCGLVEHALTVGCDAIALRCDDTEPARPTCVTEFIVRAPAFPDFLQHSLWKVVRTRRGEVSTLVEREKCHIRFKLPLERRAAAAVPTSGLAQPQGRSAVAA